MAWRAGARVSNMEFMQFHPTMLYDPGRPSFLITEALRGFGAVLIDERGAAFTDPLQTRDVVSRAIVAQMQESGAECVYLDVTRPRRRPDPSAAFPTSIGTVWRWAWT